MSQFKNKSNYKKKQIEKVVARNMERINPFVAGIDIGSRSHFVAAPITSGEIMVREFSSFTPDLQEMVHWLKENKITSVAMESTGVYWIPIYDLLEENGIEAKLVDAHKIKNVSGRKTDITDCQWLQQLHAYGLLSGAFRPSEEILPLRTYMRQRATLISQAARCIQHIQKALTQMNLHLAHVLNDIAGKTGMKIIRAIVEGERDAKVLASFRDSRCQRDQAIIEKSLTGHYREEHLFSVKQSLESFDFYQKLIFECDQKIEEALKKLYPIELQAQKEEPAQKIIKRGRKSQSPPDFESSVRTCHGHGGNTFYFDVFKHLKHLLKVDPTAIPGINENTCLKIFSEVGTDMNRWPSSKHFASWLGLSPENKVSGGRQISSRTKKVKNRAAEAFKMAALSVGRTLTALGAYYRRIKARQGAPKAITATAHKIATILYNMCKHGTEFVEFGMQVYEEKYRERKLKSLQRQADEFGFSLIANTPTQLEENARCNLLLEAA